MENWLLSAVLLAVTSFFWPAPLMPLRLVLGAKPWPNQPWRWVASMALTGFLLQILSMSGIGLVYFVATFFLNRAFIGFLIVLYLRQRKEASVPPLQVSEQPPEDSLEKPAEVASEPAEIQVPPPSPAMAFGPINGLALIYWPLAVLMMGFSLSMHGAEEQAVYPLYLLSTVFLGPAALVGIIAKRSLPWMGAVAGALHVVALVIFWWGR
jgi:hypothetical protein